MRASNLLLTTLKESPSEAEVMSHKLMIRAAMIRKLASGLYTWLPLGLRVLHKVEAIIRDEMNGIGAQEILMPAVQPQELWEETKRWEQYGPTLLKMKDRQNREYCFGPTHEEVVTDLIRREIKSYKQLPLTLFQIQMKFRDEIRPRFGIMRAREFLMKDAYSFHLDLVSLQDTYQILFDAYCRIFTRLGLNFRPVLADTGNIGGTGSHEFQVLADAGEDLIAYCETSSYAANIEQAEALKPKEPRPAATEALGFVKTPGIKSVEEQAKFLKLQNKDILKTFIVKGKTEEYPFVAVMVRGDHDINPVKAQKLPLVSDPFTLASIEDVQRIANCSPGFVGPKGINLPLIADHAVLQMGNFICGANQNDTHYSGFNWGRDCEEPEAFDLRNVVEGDPSPDGQGTLRFTRGIEVGHIFQLGDKYSRSMTATVLDESGTARELMMGCYGIGVSRIVAAAIEQYHDEKGIIWPEAMAPFSVVLIAIGLHKSPALKEAAEKLYQELQEANIDVLYDDRDERAGVMFNDAELIGIPHRLVLSEKNLEANIIEYKSRKDGNTQHLSRAQIISFLKSSN